MARSFHGVTEKCPNCHKSWPDFERTPYCPHCGIQNPNYVIPGKNQCGNCHAFLRNDDSFCRKCGTKVGEGAFEPYWNFESCIYGPPPIERDHSCPNCGYSWKNCVMIDDDRYCPKCGNIVEVSGDDVFL